MVIYKDCNKVHSQQNIKKDMILVENKLHETDAELEASLKQSFLLSSAQCNMSQSSIYTATKLKALWFIIPV